MAILTASQDSLRSDPLRDQDEELDLLGARASRRIRTMDDELGFAVHPEEKEGIGQLRKDVDAEVGRLTGLKRDYQRKYQSALAAADEQAGGILGQYRNVPGQDTVSVNVVGSGGVEGTYRVNRDWANQNLGALNPTASGGALNVSTRQGGRTVGQEVHEALASVHGQTNVGNRQISRANDAINRARSGVSAEIAAQRAQAERAYNQEISQFNRAISETKAIYTRYISDQQEAFVAGVQNNTGGIRDLLQSGALVAKGEIS